MMIEMTTGEVTKATARIIGSAVEALHHESGRPTAEADATALLALFGLPADTARTTHAVVFALQDAGRIL